MGNVLVKEIWINAPVPEVFKCFTDAKAMAKWHGKVVELNPVPGGIYKVEFESGDIIVGEFKEIEINKRLLYIANYWNVQTIIEIRFTPDSNGTRLNVRQEFLPDQDTSSFSHGWDYFLGILKNVFI